MLDHIKVNETHYKFCYITLCNAITLLWRLVVWFCFLEGKPLLCIWTLQAHNINS